MKQVAVSDRSGYYPIHKSGIIAKYSVTFKLGWSQLQQRFYFQDFCHHIRWFFELESVSWSLTKYQIYGKNIGKKRESEYPEESSLF